MENTFKKGDIVRHQCKVNRGYYMETLEETAVVTWADPDGSGVAIRRDCVDAELLLTGREASRTLRKVFLRLPNSKEVSEMTREELLTESVRVYLGIFPERDEAKEREMFGWSSDETLREWLEDARRGVEGELFHIRTEAEYAEQIRELEEADARETAAEIASMRRDRDEWDDFWNDRAKDCGAVRF